MRGNVKAKRFPFQSRMNNKIDKGGGVTEGVCRGKPEKQREMSILQRCTIVLKRLAVLSLSPCPYGVPFAFCGEAANKIRL